MSKRRICGNLCVICVQQDLKRRQAEHLLTKVWDMARTHNIHTIIAAGDFNSVPGSPVYNVMTTPLGGVLWIFNSALQSCDYPVLLQPLTPLGHAVDWATGSILGEGDSTGPRTPTTPPHHHLNGNAR